MPEFPDIEVTRLNVDEERDAARALGIRRYPALAHEDRRLAVLFMTRRRIRRFMAQI